MSNLGDRPDLYERVDAEVSEGRLWRAKEILQGNMGWLGYDLDLFEKYGQVLLEMGDTIEAGKFLFLSGRRVPEYEEAIDLYLARYKRKDALNLPAAFPRVARRSRLADYPPAVQQELRGAGIAEAALADLPASAIEQKNKPSRAADIGLKIGCWLVFVLVLCLMMLGIVKTVELIVRLF